MSLAFERFDYFRKQLLAMKIDDDLYLQRLANDSESSKDNKAELKFYKTQADDDSSNKFRSFSYLEYLLNRKANRMS